MSFTKLMLLSAFAAFLSAFSLPAHALTMAECSAKYAAAKQSDSLNGMNWNAFRKAECAAARAAGPAMPTPPADNASNFPPLPEGALSFKECSVKYRAAKADGSIAGRRWDEFRQGECGHELTRETADVTANVTSAPAPVLPQAAPPVALMQTAPDGVTFPAAVAAAFQTETPSKARMRTCLQQYHANKSAGTLAGLRWVQKGGGYYSLCSRRLKAAGV